MIDVQGPGNNLLTGGADNPRCRFVVVIAGDR